MKKLPTQVSETLSRFMARCGSEVAGMLGHYLAQWEPQMDPLLVEWTKLGLEISAADYVRAQIMRNEFRDRVRHIFPAI